MFMKHDFAAKITVDPRGAAREILQKFAECDCVQKRVAKQLGCGQGTLIRWIAMLDARGTGLRAKLDALKARRGKG